jgi:hypothetical protein
MQSFVEKLFLTRTIKEKRIEIAFRPMDGKFDVTDAAIRKDPEFIPDISEMWASGKGSWKIINEFFEKLQAKRPLSENEKDMMSRNIDRIFDLQRYPFTALEIAPTVDEEQVADIFVRINSEGVKLYQADFILTLLSVFWDQGRAELEKFSRDSRNPPKPSSVPSPYNLFIQPGPDQLLRVAVALGFQRGRLKSVYQVLRGKDMETDLFSAERKGQQFERLMKAQKDVLNLTYWHQFFSILMGAGFRSGHLISSENTLLYSYAFYLLGKTQYHVPEHDLQKLIGKWFYAASISGRYTNSPETVMDGDLNRIKDLSGPESFISTIEKIVADTLTGDFWSITLPNLLETSSARSPGLFAYYAALNRLGAQVLFSHKKTSDLLDPYLRSKKSALEHHHLFPRAWLEDNGITDLKLINQVANFALLEWPDNIGISDAPPSKYLFEMKKRFDDIEWEKMCEMHALPDGWESLVYEDFLIKRRALMSLIIRKGFEVL